MSNFGNKSDSKCLFTSLNAHLTFVKLLDILHIVLIVQRCTGNTDLPILELVWFVIVSLLAVELAKYTTSSD